jgi:NAD synthase
LGRESLIGYTTIYGDNASALNPIGDLQDLAQAERLDRVNRWPGSRDSPRRLRR